MNCCTFGDKEQMTDLLQSEKFLASAYNSYVLECATPEVARCLSELLCDTHTAQQQLFEEMQSRGWYSVTKSEEQKIMQAKQKLGSLVCQ